MQFRKGWRSAKKLSVGSFARRLWHQTAHFFKPTGPAPIAVFSRSCLAYLSCMQGAQRAHLLSHHAPGCRHGLEFEAGAGTGKIAIAVKISSTLLSTRLERSMILSQVQIAMTAWSHVCGHIRASALTLNTVGIGSRGSASVI